MDEGGEGGKAHEELESFSEAHFEKLAYLFRFWAEMLLKLAWTESNDGAAGSSIYNGRIVLL